MKQFNHPFYRVPMGCTYVCSALDGTMRYDVYLHSNYLTVRYGVGLHDMVSSTIGYFARLTEEELRNAQHAAVYSMAILKLAQEGQVQHYMFSTHMADLVAESKRQQKTPLLLPPNAVLRKSPAPVQDVHVCEGPKDAIDLFERYGIKSRIFDC